MQSTKKEKIKFYTINLLIFLALIVFMVKVFPLVPFDGDDWRYTGSMRLPFPQWGVWNPTRVLPEVLMPLAGYIAAYIIYPLFGHYVFAITLVDAFVYAGFVMLMLVSFYHLLRKRLKTSVNISLSAELLLFISMFLLFKHVGQPSFDLLWSGDLCCVFFYVIPGLLNTAMLFYLESESNISVKFRQFKVSKQSLIIIALYFAMLSSTQFNIILAAYSFIMLCIESANALRENGMKIRLILNRAWFYLLILIVWLITVLFDLHGGRASSVSTNKHQHVIQATFDQFINVFKLQNKLVLLLFVFIIAAALLIAIKGLKENSLQGNLPIRLLMVSFGTLLIVSAYLFIAYVKAGSQYAARTDATWPVWMMFLVMVSMAFVYLLQSCKVVRIFTPLFLLMAALIAVNFNYLPVIRWNDSNCSPQTMYAVDNYIISQVVKAEVTVKVPLDGKNGDNWPHSYAMEKWMQNTLYSHGIIRSRMKIDFQPSKKVNQRFYENKSKEQQEVPPE